MQVLLKLNHIECRLRSQVGQARFGLDVILRQGLEKVGKPDNFNSF